MHICILVISYHGLRCWAEGDMGGPQLVFPLLLDLIAYCLVTTTYPFTVAFLNAYCVVKLWTSLLMYWYCKFMNCRLPLQIKLCYVWLWYILVGNKSTIPLLLQVVLNFFAKIVICRTFLFMHVMSAAVCNIFFIHWLITCIHSVHGSRSYWNQCKRGRYYENN